MPCGTPIVCCVGGHTSSRETSQAWSCVGITPSDRFCASSHLDSKDSPQNAGLESAEAEDAQSELYNTCSLQSDSGSDEESSQELSVPPSPLKKPRNRMLVQRGK